MIDPELFFFISGITALHPRKTDFKFTLICLSHSSSEKSSNGAIRAIPALFTRISIFPYSYIVLSIVFSQSFEETTSCSINTA